MTAFDYPPASPRRHGPVYSSYASYKDWLRDEFTFRCAYCLQRERWVRAVATFAIDHFLPVAIRPDLGAEYTNLVYACESCNSLKSDRVIADPTVALTLETVRVDADGIILPLTPAAQKIVMGLELDRPEATEFRRQWISIIRLAEAHDPTLFARLMGFPDDLPYLSRLRPESNARPEGVAESFHARRLRGELPATY